jgi:hypothetical protein
MRAVEPCQSRNTGIGGNHGQPPPCLRVALGNGSPQWRHSLGTSTRTTYQLS